MYEDSYFKELAHLGVQLGSFPGQEQGPQKTLLTHLHLLMQVEFVLGRRLGMPVGTQETLKLPTPSQSLIRQTSRIHTHDLQTGRETFMDGTASPAALGQLPDLVPLFAGFGE